MKQIALILALAITLLMSQAKANVSFHSDGSYTIHSDSADFHSDGTYDLHTRNSNLGGYDSTETYNPTPTYEYYEYS